jgi:hypothetical protein
MPSFQSANFPAAGNSADNESYIQDSVITTVIYYVLTANVR